MANRTVTVKSSGGDYTSLNAALSGESKDLVTNTQILTIECYSMGDTTAADTGTGYTPNTSYYINIIAPSSERHSGVWTTSKYRLDVSSASYALHIQEDSTRITGLQIRRTSSGECFRLVGGGSTYVAYCFVRSENDGIGFRGSGTAYVYNTICITDAAGGGSDEAFLFVGPTTTYAYNCTAIIQNSSGDTFDALANTVIGKNLISYGGTGFAGGSWHASSTNNASSIDQEVPGSSGRKNQTFTFVDAANENYHLASNDAGARDYGANLSGDANLAFSDDIDGQTRSGTWDIGADEYVAPPVGIPLHILQPQPFAHILVR